MEPSGARMNKFIKLMPTPFGKNLLGFGKK